uniref:Transmembrane 9 superfamily member n=1 Tax=Leptocylindrus danicus TaxID=163516 RepID=A0A7S2JQY9_9STRA|mmetsp:Transcript_10537/g.15817  ORF Transcript_10537/g.15817 Transcript_10537/m.15817 type:complete len:660 (+) Transcript_10537:86-2065(+)
MMRQLLLTIIASPAAVWGHYLPGVTAKSFAEGDLVKLKVNKMTSQKTLYPVEYYKLPFCQPAGGPKSDSENLGEFLTGDRIESSPYILRMKKDMYCEQVCVSNLGRAESTDKKSRKKDANRMVGAIRRNYHNNWIVDNLSAASISEDDKSITTKFYQGFPVGYIDKASKLAMVNNHVNIIVHYHPVETGDDAYRVVMFLVEPFSIAHQFKDLEGSTEVELINPIESCDPTKRSKTNHTAWDMFHKNSMQQQVASGRVLFTYDVSWVKSDVKWGSRWDIYLNMGGAVPDRVHWLNILNSVLVVLVLTFILAAILVRNLRRDLVRYSRVATDEEKVEDLEDFGWKLVHADVFRPPSTAPMLLSVMCGTGAQLVGCSLTTIIFSALGFLNPSYRGGLIMGLLSCFVIMGGVAGYVSASLYKTFKGKSWQKNTTMTALFFPGVVFSVFFFLDMCAISQKSSDSVPFTTLVVLLLMWFGVSTPLVFCGAYLGYKRDAIEFPVNTSSIPRQVPDQPFYFETWFCALIGGGLPFGSCFVEYYFILSSLWMDQYYYVFGVLLVVWIILLFMSAEVATLINYFTLCSEDYHWWWRSFITSGSVSFYFFLYSWYYFGTFEDGSVNFSTYMLYFGYMGLICFGVFCMTGYVGLATCLWFNRKIYGSIKVD